MSHFVNDQIIDTIRDLVDLVAFLESELEVAGTHGEIARADQIYLELVDARRQLDELEARCGGVFDFRDEEFFNHDF